jgi:cell division protein FtsW (lipid II flippase)
MTRRLVFWVTLLIAAGLLALWLDDVIQAVVIVPAAYLLWLMGLALRSVSTWVYWGLLIAVVAIITLASLLGRWRPRRHTPEDRAPVPGAVEQMAGFVHNAHRGPYFRWLVARRLAELVGATRQHLGTGRDVAPPEIQAYLDAGLDRPPIGRGRRRVFFRAPATPLDGVDLERVVEYLESQMEMRE